ncbi:MAG: ABC-F family ATP-binding cassette domain-containing protein [Ruminococcaceae bacterium]|nr:ABC-F family ATP-binding cassette domain-containing protein [Oscillospiraceae bacterium]
MCLVIDLQIEIHKGQVDLSGEPILNDINLNIITNSRIGLVGRNGCGKTTLLRLLCGELSLANTESDGGFMAISGNPQISALNQMTFSDDSVTLVEEIRSAYTYILNLKSELDNAERQMNTAPDEDNIKRYTDLLEAFTREGGFYFEKEYEAAIKKFGFTESQKNRPLSEFSGGQRTKIAFLKLLLSKPDLLLLDEPTNHLDIEAVSWLEDYIKNYKKAVLIVSHDRMFLDNTVNEIYEIEHGKTTRYVGNYSQFVAQKKVQRAQQAKDFEAQQAEIARIQATADRFRYKATKAAMAQSKLKAIERMEKIDAPDSYDNRTFKAGLEVSVQSAKEVLSVNNLTIGFDVPLATLSFNVYRGDRVGIIGGNGMGKSTLVKTLVGKVPALSGTFTTGALVNAGYFDQQMAQIKGNETVLDNMMSAFPALNEFEARSALGAFLFSGEAVFKTIDMLSGGERVRLALCKLFKKSPNLLILDEPTNHMDIISKETLEDILLSYNGTLIFVSHDRYFVKKLADRLITFENGSANVWDFGYDEYMLRQAKAEVVTDTPQRSEKKEKKTYTTPLKEKAKRERALKKAEDKIAELEQKLEELKLEQQNPENLSDYQKLSELQECIDACEAQLLEQMEIWEELA